MYTNSPLAGYTLLSPNHSGYRTHAIDRITPHCTAGHGTAASIAAIFANPKRQASCQYAIGDDGIIALVVDEANRSWCSSSNANDQRAVTIECASDAYNPYPMSETVYGRLVDLCADVCQRNSKDTLIWIADKSTALAYQPAKNEMLLTVHRWFANKACPGDWLMGRMGELADEVNSRLKGDSDMNAEQNRMLTEVYTMLTRKDNAGYEAIPDGHNIFGRMCRTEQQVERTDNAGHKTPNGHNLYGRINMLQEDTAALKAQIANVQKQLKTITEALAKK